MAIPSFPLRRPCPRPPLPTPSDSDLVRSLLRLSSEISHFEPPKSLQHRNFSSIARKSKLLAVLFDDLLRDPAPDLPRSASLCLKEILLVLQRFKALLGDCSTRSRMLLLLQAETVANEFHELTLELSILLDILPLAKLDVGEDVRDVVDLVRRQCRRSAAAVDPAEAALRGEIFDIISGIEREIVPDRSKLELVFVKLGLDDCRSCRTEIESLEREIGDRIAEKWTAAMIALVALVRYGKCVIYGASTPTSESAGKSSFSATDLVVPADFRCPISLELMRDPVVVSSGQTYDRESIGRWITSGHATCPKSGQALFHTNLIPNKALNNLISRWCREHNVPFDGVEPGNGGEAIATSSNKAALEASRMTASFLVQKLADSPSTEAVNRVVHDLRQLAKSGSDNRAFVAEAGAVPLLLPLLRSEDPGLQVNAVTTLLNLSILEANKKRIMHVDGGVDGIIDVMARGATWRAKENAAATILSLSSIHAYRRRLGRNRSVIDQLLNLVKAGPTSTKKDALAAILSLAGDRDNIARLVEGGVVETALEAVEAAEEAVAVIAAVAKRGGAEAVGEVQGSTAKLVRVLRRGSDWARESAAAALVLVFRRAGGSKVAELMATPGIERVIWELMGSGTERARRKAAALGRICRRWTAAVEADRTAVETDRTARFSALTILASTATVLQA